MSRKHSEQLFRQAQKHIPGGVNSPVRAFKSVGGTPVFFHSARGAYLFDEDDNQYIDYVGSWGPMILGHNHPHVVGPRAAGGHERQRKRAPPPHQEREWDARKE